MNDIKYLESWDNATKLWVRTMKLISYNTEVLICNTYVTENVKRSRQNVASKIDSDITILFLCKGTT